jgi:RimJ/RimL family protein N-acetyltransferase
MSPELLTDRLRLRAYRDADARLVSEAIEESRAALEQWTPEIASRRSVAEVAAGLAGLQCAWSSRRKRVFGMFERWTGRFVGEVGLYTIDWDSRAATVGVWMRESARGSDLAREGFAALCTHAAHELGLERLDAHIHPANARSRHLAERVGFRLHGSLPGTPARDGTASDMLVYRFGEVAGEVNPPVLGT